ncbi:putative RNA-directed DNA polymerase [Helianthus annuus]|nr:putative RNA-directed DNA polymerase [Helianthus annuus]
MRNFWGRANFDFEYVGSNGRSGGILSAWDPSIFSKSVVVKNRNFLLISGTVKGFSEGFNILNIYAPQGTVAKRALWQQLKDLRQSTQGFWVLFGDFNAVRFQEDRKNSVFDVASSNDFNDFIYASDLHEFLMKGRKFTFCKGKGSNPKLSKIDRFLVCHGFMERWSDACLLALPRFLSDHSPLVLAIDPIDYGPIPFRVFNSWIDKGSLADVVKSASDSFSFTGNPDLYLAKKLQHLKKAIKAWAMVTKNKEEELKDSLISDLCNLDEVMESRDLEEDDLWIYSECKSKLLELEEGKLKDLKQISRVKWSSFGDENSAYFHGMIKNKEARSKLHGLVINGQWCNNPKLVKREAQKFFANRFKENWAHRPSLSCPNIKKLSDEEAFGLVEPFSATEIKGAVWDCGGDKAPGPDGFNFRFIKRFWDILGADFVAAANHFHEVGSISRGCSSSFISLIPKTNDPVSLNEFRPINLIGSFSKVISKILANRLKKVLNSVISDSQSAFLKGRNIIDGPLIINEILAWIKKKKSKALLFKIDFEKAFDNINWNYIIFLLEQMNFPSKWRIWVKGILSSARSSVLINGSPTFEFDFQKGIRQGDPLSPFLFIIGMEGMVCMLNKAVENGIFKGFVCPNGGPIISHLLFADDALLLGEWSKENTINMARILRCFHLVSGLKINYSKSKLFGIGANEIEVLSFANSIGCDMGSLPCSYLGLVIGANMNRINHWAPVLDAFDKRLSLWKASVLSTGGRITLLKAVMETLPTYYFSLFKAPAYILAKLEAKRRNFFWGGKDGTNKISWVGWKKITTPIEAGGLGLTPLRDANIALLMKWWWRFKIENNALWKKVVVSIHNSNRSWPILPYSKSVPGTWSTIAKLENHLANSNVNLGKLIKGELGRGDKIRFWIDPWLLLEI